MAEGENRWSSVFDVAPSGHPNAAMVQLLAGGQQSVSCMNLASKFLSQAVQRSLRDDPLCPKPRDQGSHVLVAAVTTVGRIKGQRRRVALNDKAAPSPRKEAAEEFHEFRVLQDIAFGIVRLRAIELGHLNADQSFIPPECGPWENVDFVPPQASHRAKQEDLSSSRRALSSSATRSKVAR